MKLFISADIEGCAGIAMGYETHKEEAAYAPFAKQMTREVVAVCRAALEAGADEIVVKDGHGDATNIDPMEMPEHVTLIRGKSGHPANMMFGLDASFDAAIFLGYHAPAGDPGSPLSHTSTGNSSQILLNGKPMSEMLLNAYTAALHGVPVVMISGDARICELSGEVIPGIAMVATKRGEGASSFQLSPATVMRCLVETTTQVVESLEERKKRCMLKMPETFTYEVSYKDWKKAYRMSFFPGVEAVDARTNRLVSQNWMDIVTAHSFLVY